MIRNYLVNNRHLQLQLLLIQFLSVVLAESTNSSLNIVEMAENSTQSSARNQIAGKFAKHFQLFHFKWFAQSTQSNCAAKNFYSIIGLISFPLNCLLSKLNAPRQLRLADLRAAVVATTADHESTLRWEFACRSRLIDQSVRFIERQACAN